MRSSERQTEMRGVEGGAGLSVRCVGLVRVSVSPSLWLHTGHSRYMCEVYHIPCRWKFPDEQEQTFRNTASS
jgi:hypothetical protein